MGGRMTFRFDTDKDNGKPRLLERTSGAGLRPVRDDAAKPVQREQELPLQVWPYSPGYEAEQDHLPEDLVNDEFEPLDLWERGPVEPLPFREIEEDYREPYLAEQWDREPERFGDISMSTAGFDGSYHAKRPSHWWKFALSTAGALGTGLLLGYAALSFISGGGSGNDGGTANVDSAAVQSQTGGLSDQPVAGDTGLPINGTGEIGHIPVAVAAQSYYLLQYGVFSSPAGASQAQQELLAAGLAAGIDPADGNRVYAGMSPDREQAKLLSSGLKNQGIELYVREVDLPAAEQASFAGSAEAVNGYFAASGKMLNELSGLSASLLSGTGVTVDYRAVSDLHMQWAEAVKALEPGLTPEGQSLCGNLEKAMSRGIAALNEYDKNKAPGLLWEVQESMLNFLSNQKSLLATLN